MESISAIIRTRETFKTSCQKLLQRSRHLSAASLPTFVAYTDIAKLAHAFLLEEHLARAKHNDGTKAPLSADAAAEDEDLSAPIVSKNYGASTRACAITAQKVLVRRYVDGMDTIRFAAVSSRERFLPHGFPGFTGDAILKPVSGTGSVGDIRVLRNFGHCQLANPYRGAINADDSSAFDDIVTSIFPEARGIVGLLEEYVPNTVRKATVEGVIQNGVVHAFTISDNVYCEDEPEKFNYLCVPTQHLSPEEQESCRKLYAKVLHSLWKKFGLDNQFVNIEMFIFDDGTVKVMEINGRMSANQILSFRNALHVNPAETMMQLQRHEKLTHLPQ